MRNLNVRCGKQLRNPNLSWRKSRRISTSRDGTKKSPRISFPRNQISSPEPAVRNTAHAQTPCDFPCAVLRRRNVVVARTVSCQLKSSPRNNRRWHRNAKKLKLGSLGLEYALHHFKNALTLHGIGVIMVCLAGKGGRWGGGEVGGGLGWDGGEYRVN